MSDEKLDGVMTASMTFIGGMLWAAVIILMAEAIVGV